MATIARTRIKKLKKLILNSYDIINFWGWAYFFYIAKNEWNNQKLTLFAPDAKPVPHFERLSFQQKYEQYLNSIEEKFLKEKPSTEFPQITIVLFYESTKIQLIQDSIKSFLNQSYTNWNLLLISKDSNVLDSSLLPKDQRISLLSNCENNTILEKINSLESDHLSFIDSNIILPSYSLEQFVKFLIKNSDSDIIYSDHDIINENKVRIDPFFKPNWSLITFRSYDYVSSFCMIKAEIVKKVLISEIIDNNFSFDLLLHCIDNSKNFSHIPYPLYSITSLVPQPSIEYKKNLLAKHLVRNNVDAKIENGILPNTFRINYDLKSSPKVTILIPTRNNRKILKRCIKSIEKKTHYKNFEIIIIDNPQIPSETDFDSKLKNYYDSLSYKIVTFNGNFNFSKMNNLAAKESTGDLLLFLNDDTKILDEFWLDEMVSILLNDNVGAVGTKLIYGDETLQHAGMVFLKSGSGFHPFVKLDHDATGYHNTANIMKECSAVTGACLLTTRDIFEEIGEYDNDFDVYYGDSDLCLKIRRAGYKVVYTPFTKLLHEGSRSIRRAGSYSSYFAVEAHQLFLEKWPELEDGDPFYHPILDWDYSLGNTSEDKSSPKPKSPYDMKY